MTKWQKLMFALMLLGIAILIFGALWLSQVVVSYRSEVNHLSAQVAAIPAPSNGKDGYTPVKGVDYTDGINGTNGTNAVSTNTTIVEQQAVPGPKGDTGASAPTTQIQIDPITGDLETKLSVDAIWTILVPCAKLIVSCPNPVSVSPPLINLPSL